MIQTTVVTFLIPPTLVREMHRLGTYVNFMDPFQSHLFPTRGLCVAR